MASEHQAKAILAVYRAVKKGGYHSKAYAREMAQIVINVIDPIRKARRAEGV